jgi:amino acid adenylation domain-containing protein
MSEPHTRLEPAFQAKTLLGLARTRACHQPDQLLYTFLPDGETEEGQLTFGDLDRGARAVAALLQEHGLEGQRVLLLYPPGLDYVVGFFGCLYAGTIAVPAYPPDPTRLDRTLPRLQTMAGDAGAIAVLTTTPIHAMAQALFQEAGDLGALHWLATDQLAAGAEHGWQEPPITEDSLAFLQYTSGCTRTPRGVMLNHGNLLHNSALITAAFEMTAADVVVSWLPPYHDMGLIGAILQPVYRGISCILMPPAAFLGRPYRWLEAISRYQATISGGPNFAYDLCARKVSPEQRASLDLSRWSVAFNGSEPVRAATLEQFAAAFEPCGFRRAAFYPCYGLAEATLMATGSSRAAPPVLLTVDKGGLERQQVIPASAAAEDAQTLVGCGRPPAGLELAIVHPETHRPVAPDQVGEIWISSASVAQGYWNRPEETEQTFRARRADTGAGPFLRTGDLGFLKDGELFVAGRSKDLIIIRGRNHYPQDIELTVEQSHPALRPGCGAAFSVDVAGEERLVVVQEIYTPRVGDMDEVTGAVRQAVADAHNVQVHTVALIQPRSIPKTSSGKIQRTACKAAFLGNSLEMLHASTIGEAVALPAEESAASQPLRAASQSLLVKALLAMAPEARQALLESHLTEMAARVLKIHPGELHTHKPLGSLGLDSVLVIDLLSELEASLGIILSADSLPLDISISRLASQVLEELRAAPAVPAAGPAAAPESAGAGEYPLSYGQRALWFLQEMAPDTGSYNLVHAGRVRGELDVQTLRRAFQQLMDRHPALRTTFTARDGEPVQCVHAHTEVHFSHVDASGWSEAYLKERLAEQVYRPFDLERGPLMRVAVFDRPAGEHLILLATHHIVTDLWSLAIVLHELSVIYAAEQTGETPALKPLRTRYADYVHWQADLLDGPEGERLWAFWQKQMAGDLPALNLPADRPRPPVQTYRGAMLARRVDAELTDKLRTLGQTCHANLFTVLLAAFQVLLHRYTGQDDILVGSPKAGRNKKSARLVGYFVNPIVLRADLAGNPSFATFLEQVRRTVAEANEHDAYPFARLVERLQPGRDLSRSPIFQAMFAWQKTTRVVDSQGIASFTLNEAGGGLELGELLLEAFALDDRVAPFDLTLMMVDVGDELMASLEYNAALFDAETAARVLEHFKTLLAGIVADPDRPISELPLSSEAERRALVGGAGRREPDLPYRSIAQPFEAQAARRPDTTALLLGDTQLTYGELNRRANQLAYYLRRLGVGPEVIVGVLAERSLEAMIGLVAVLKAGGVYLPLDPANPHERLAFMLEDARAEVLLAQADLVTGWTEQGVRVVRLDADRDAIAAESGEDAGDYPAADNLAYLVYTSGSTGKPKGVLVANGAIAEHCRDVQALYQLDESDRVLQFASLGFDQALEQILAALAAGAALVLRGPEVPSPADFSGWISQFGLTVANLPPAFWHEWAKAASPTQSGASLHGLRLVIVGGDVLSAESLRLWEQTPWRSARLLNAYGPTEATITASIFVVPPGFQGSRVPIGRPVGGRALYIRDAYGNLAPVGVPGELYVGGSGLARGYLGRPDLTAERFVPDPFGFSLPPAFQRGESEQVPPFGGLGGSEAGGARLYKTGDLARYLPDGNVEFLGRVDNQVKIRGFRIELGEIEAALGRHPEVAEAVVVARDAEAGSKALTAYLVAAGEATPEAGRMRDFLRTSLPDYMIPSAFVWLEAMPRTASGKVDRRSLPEAEHIQSLPEEGYVAPRTPVEKELAAMWAQVLGLQRVGVHDDFFDLGGHSLLATQLVARIRAAFGVDLPLRAMFEATSVAELAALLAQRLAEGVEEEELEELLAELEGLSPAEIERLLIDQAL